MTAFRPVVELLVLAVLVLAACARAAPTATPTQVPPTPTATRAAVVAPTATPTTAPAVVRATATPTLVPAAPTPTAKRAPRGTLNVVDRFSTEVWLLRMNPGGQFWYLGEPLMGWDWEKDAPTNEAILESWEIKQNPDGSQDFTLKIKKGVKFHKGWGEVTAEDIKFTLLDEMKPGTVNANARRFTDWFGRDANNITVIDNYNMKIHQPVPQSVVELFRVLSAEEGRTLRPFPKKYFEQVGEDEFARNPVLAGPYEFVSHQRGYSLRLKAVPDHYRVTPGFAELVYYNVIEQATRVAMLRTGQVDVSPVTAQFASELKASGINIAISENGTEPFIAFGGLFPNRPKCDPTVPWVGGCKTEDMLAEKPTKIRKALNLTVDRQAIVDKIMFGYGEIGVISFSFISPKMPWWNSEWKPLPFDPKEAKKLLAEAGYPNCFEFNHWITTDQAYGPEISEAVVSTWEKELGCKVKRRVGEYRPTLRTMLLERNTSGWTYYFQGSPIARPFRYACLHGGPDYEVITHTELGFYTELCRKADAALDIAEQVKLERQIGDLEYKYFPTTAVALNHQPFGVGPKVKEWKPMPKKSDPGNLEYALPR